MAPTAPLTLMAVHAHPDDESSSTGGVLARYRDAGVRTVVVTCTNGEYGDGPGRVKPGEEGHDPKEVAKTRLAELDRACEILGVSDLELLGFHDSGMADWTFKEDPEAFCNVAVNEGAARLAELFSRYRPDVVVTYDDAGGYNHPDHVQAHRITVAAVAATGIPRKLYFTARRRGDWEKIRARMAELGMEVPQPPQIDPERLKRMQEMEARITTSVDVSAWVERKRAALAAHASQLDESWFSRLPDDMFGEIFGHETFIRERDATGAPVPEDDLLAGLR